MEEDPFILCRDAALGEERKVIRGVIQYGNIESAFFLRHILCRKGLYFCIRRCVLGQLTGNGPFDRIGFFIQNDEVCLL